jgi:lysozyme
MITEISDIGLSLLETDEGLRLKAYDDATGESVEVGGTCIGKITIGYGHTGPNVVPGMVITKEQAVTLLDHDVMWAEKAVSDHVSSEISLNQNQFDALCCFTYNVGLANFIGSTLLKCVNAGNFVQAHSEFGKWNKSGGKVMAGLIKRRADEAALFARA